MKPKKSRPKPSFLKKALRTFSVTAILSLAICVATVYRLFFKDDFRAGMTLTVPNLAGSTLGDASMPDSEAFQIVRVERFSDAPIGTVLGQSPAGGSKCKINRSKRYATLTLYVSKGRECVTVPTVVGLPAAEAEAALLALGFSVERTAQYDRAPIGETLAQSVLPGTALRKGDTVTLTVSRGSAAPRVRVPDLKGLSRVRAESLLGAFGLRVGQISFRTSDDEENRVLSQLPLEGTPLSGGACVDLVLSKKPPVESDTSEETETEAPETNENDAESAPEPQESKSDEDALKRRLDRLFEQILPDFSQN